MLRTLFVAAFCLLVVTGCNRQRDPNGGVYFSRIDIREVMEQIEALSMAENIDGVLRLMPPRVFEVQAERTGMTVDEVYAQMHAIMVPAMQMTRFEAVETDFSTLTTGESANGRYYGIVMVNVDMWIDEIGTRTSSPTVVLNDGGTLYALRVTDQQWDLFVAAYPDMGGVTLPANTSVALQPDHY